MGFLYAAPVVLTLLVLQNTSVVLVTKYSFRSTAAAYNVGTVVLLSELLKFFTCCVAIVTKSGSFHLVSMIRGLPDNLNLALPSILYVVQNSAHLVAIKRLSAPVYVVCAQSKVLTTAIFYVLILGKSLSPRQVLALGYLVCGLVLVQLEPTNTVNHESPSSNLIGLSAVFTSSLISGYVGVYLEKNFKEKDHSLWERNLFLSMFSLPCALIAIFVPHSNDIGTLFGGLDSVVALVILLKALGGLIVALVMRYATSILKNFSVAISICLCAVFSMLTSGQQIHLSMALGICCVCVSIFTYSSGYGNSRVHFGLLAVALPGLLVLSVVLFKWPSFSTAMFLYQGHLSGTLTTDPDTLALDERASCTTCKSVTYFITGHTGILDGNVPVLPSNFSIFATNLKSMSDKANAARWRVADINATVNDYIASTMSSKQMKVYPQRILPSLGIAEEEVDFVVWFDNKFDVNTAGVLNVTSSWDPTHAVMFHLHPFLCCGFDSELEESMKQPRYFAQRGQYLAYADQEVAAGYKRNGEKHFQGGFIIYNLRHKKTRLFQDTWWDHIQRCGIQDQLSLYFVAQRFKDDIGIFHDRISVEK